MDIEPIHSLANYIREVALFASSERNVLFRGQRIDEPLLPAISRYTTPTFSLSAEASLFAEFKRRSVGLIDTIDRDEWDWLALAQHHGVPTRLLDWTQNALAALWFAVRQPRKQGFAPVVWMFMPHPKDFQEVAAANGPFSSEHTIVYRPRHASRRVTAQAGMFTVHTYVEKTGRFIPLESQKRYAKQLKKLTINKDYARGQLPKELDRCGVNASTLFPDLSGLGEYMEWEYTQVDYR